MSPQQIGLIVIGMLACFIGYSMFRSLLPLWGFILGGWIFFTMMPTFIHAPQSTQLIYVFGSFLLGGIIGALIATPLYLVIVFLSGASFGMMLGVMLGTLFDVGGLNTVAKFTIFTNSAFPPVPHSALQYGTMFLIGAIMGVMALTFQRMVIVISSAFLGATALITGLSAMLITLTRSATSQGAILLVGWFVLGLLGFFVQYYLTGEE